MDELFVLRLKVMLQILSDVSAYLLHLPPAAAAVAMLLLLLLPPLPALSSLAYQCGQK